MDIQKLLSASSEKSGLASINESGKAASGPVKPISCLAGDDGESDVDIDDPFGEFHIDEDLDDEVPTTVAKPQATGAVSTMSMDISDAPMDPECSSPGVDCPMSTIQPSPVPSSPNAQAMKLNDLEPTSLAQHTPAPEPSNTEVADLEMQDTTPNTSGGQVIPDQQVNRISTGANASADVEAMDVCDKEPTQQAVAGPEHQDRPTEASINKQQAAALQQTSPAGSTDVVQNAPVTTHSTDAASLQQQQPPAQSDQDSGPAASSSSVGITDPLVPTFWDNTTADCAAVQAGSAPQQTSARSFTTLAAAANAPICSLSEGKAAGTPSSSLPTAPSDGNKNGVTAARTTLERTEAAAAVGCAVTATDAPCVKAPVVAADVQPGGLNGRATVGDAPPQGTPEVSALQEELAAGTGPGQCLLDDRAAEKGTSDQVHLSAETPTHTPAAEYGVHAHRKAGMFKSGAAGVQQKEGSLDQNAALTSGNASSAAPLTQTTVTNDSTHGTGTELTSKGKKSIDSGTNRVRKPTTQSREEDPASGTVLMSAWHELGKSNVQAQARSTSETSPSDQPQKTSLDSSPGPAVESLAACNAVQKPSAADAHVGMRSSPESTALQQPVRLESSTIMPEPISNTTSYPGSPAAVPAPMASQHAPSSPTLHTALKPASTESCMKPSPSQVLASKTTPSANQIQKLPPCTNLRQSALGSYASVAAPAKRKNDPVSEPETAKQMRSTVGTGLMSSRSRVQVGNDACVASAQHSNVHMPGTQKPDGNVLCDSTNKPGLPRHQSVSQKVHDSESVEKRTAPTPSKANSGNSTQPQETAQGQHHPSQTCEPAQLQEEDQRTEVPSSITQEIGSMSGAQAITSLSKYRREIAELTVSMQEIGIRVEAAADEALELRVDAAVLKNRWGRLAQPETVGTVREELDTARRFLQEAEAAACAATSKATRMGWLKMQPEGMECDP